MSASPTRSQSQSLLQHDVDEDVYHSTYSRQFPTRTTPIPGPTNAGLAHYANLRNTFALSPASPDHYDTTSRHDLSPVKMLKTKELLECRPAPWPQDCAVTRAGAPSPPPPPLTGTLYSTTTNIAMLCNHRFVSEQQQQQPQNASDVTWLPKPKRAPRPAPSSHLLSWAEDTQQRSLSPSEGSFYRQQMELRQHLVESPQHWVATAQERSTSRPPPCHFPDTLHLFESTTGSHKGKKRQSSSPVKQRTNETPLSTHGCSPSSTMSVTSSSLPALSSHGSSGAAAIVAPLRQERLDPDSPFRKDHSNNAPTKQRKEGKKVGNPSEVEVGDWKGARQQATYETTNRSLQQQTLQLAKKSAV